MPAADLIKVPLALAAVSTAILLHAPAALAQQPVVVNAGQAPAGTRVGATLSAQGASPRVVFRTSTGSSISCVDLTARATLTAGSSATGVVGSMPGAGFSAATCVGPFGLKLIFSGNGTWTLRAAAPQTGATTEPVILDSVQLTGTFGSATNCSFTLTGSLTGTFINTSSQLSLDGTNGNLVFSDVRGGCYGMLTNGSRAGFTSILALAATNTNYNPISFKAVSGPTAQDAASQGSAARTGDSFQVA